MLLLSTLVVIALLILANALYVAAEFSVVSVRRSRIAELARGGSRLAAKLQPIVDDPKELDRYIAGAQVGITISSLVLGAYGQAQITPLLEPVFEGLGWLQAAAAQSTAAAVVLVVLSVMQMVLGELIPKSIGMQFPARTAMLTSAPMGFSLRVFRPFIWLLNGSGLAVLRLLGVEHEERRVHSAEEIHALIRESSEGGALEDDEEARLRRALSLTDRRATDVMVPRDQMVGVEVDATFADVVKLAEDAPFTRLPVYRGDFDDVIGTLHTKDVTLAVANGGETPSVRELMRPVLTVGEGTRADRIIALLREHHVQQAVVTSHGRVVGLVTFEDVLGEVLGHLADELKRARSAKRKKGKS